MERAALPPPQTIERVQQQWSLFDENVGLLYDRTVKTRDLVFMIRLPTLVETIIL